MGKTKIEWADSVWNPVTGCTKVDEGCRNCYAERMSKRLRGRHGYPADDPFRVTLHPDRLDKPLHWKKPRRIFVNSMSDLFHKDVSHPFIGSVWVMMEQCPQHQFMILTKRADLMKRVITGYLLSPLPNVWLGVSVHDRAYPDDRIPILLQTPAAKRFVSLEPCLGQVNLRWYLKCKHCENTGYLDDGDSLNNDPSSPCPGCEPALDLVILGGESGPGARPMPVEAPRLARDHCAAANVPYFFKQWGDGRFVETRLAEEAGLSVHWKAKKGGRLLDGKIHDGVI